MQYNSIYEFNDEGMYFFEQVFKGKLDKDSIDPIDERYSSAVQGTSSIVVNHFATAKEMAQAVIDSMKSENVTKFSNRPGIWAWLTYVMHDQLFREDKNGNRKYGEVHRWLPSDANDWQKGQRHLVRMPVILLSTLKDKADHMICGDPAILPEIREQLTSQQDMFSKSFQAIARALYFSDEKNGLKRGAGGKGAGSPRRLAKVKQQLDVTWELEDLEFRKIMSTLPNEFDRFKDAA